MRWLVGGRDAAADNLQSYLIWCGVTHVDGHEVGQKAFLFCCCVGWDANCLARQPIQSRPDCPGEPYTLVFCVRSLPAYDAYRRTKMGNFPINARISTTHSCPGQSTRGGLSSSGSDCAKRFILHNTGSKKPFSPHRVSTYTHGDSRYETPLNTRVGAHHQHN